MTVENGWRIANGGRASRRAIDEGDLRMTKRIELHGKPVAGGALPLVCTPLVGRTHDALLGELREVLPKKPDIVEWRCDFYQALGDPAAVLETARSLRAAAGGIPILFTRRSASEGGERVPIAEAAVVELYGEVCRSRTMDAIDYETSNPAADFERLRKAARENDVALVGSYHNFQSTPDVAALVAKFALAKKLGADVAKVAVMPKSPRDVLTLLAATCEASESLPIPLISMSMGAYGSVSRMVGAVFGSALTFAVGKSSSAPGQIPIEELRAALATVNRAAGLG
jgi:3-dehydroquinate dehydratase I